MDCEVKKGIKMQSQKKHRRPKRERVDARDYAKAFVASVGSPDKALANVTNLESVATAKSKDAGLSPSDQKEYRRLAGFWANVAGLIRKNSTLLKSTPAKQKQGA